MCFPNLMRSCLKRGLKYGPVRIHGQPWCSAGSWRSFQAQQFAAIENTYRAMSTETPMRCSAVFEKDQDIYFSPSFVINFQKHFETCTTLSGKLSGKDLILVSTLPVSPSVCSQTSQEKRSKPQPPLQGTAFLRKDGNKVAGGEDPCIV